MDATLFAAVVSAGLGLIVGLISPLLSKHLRKKESYFVTVRPSGRKEEIAVPAGASRREIETLALKSLDLEEQVGSILNQLAVHDKEMEVHTSRAVDFVAKTRGKKVAVEVKVNPRTINAAQIRRYFSAEPGIQEVIIASFGSPPRDFRDDKSWQGQNGKVRFITLSGEPLEDQRLIQKELADSFNGLSA